ncbi:M15 family metallopeptidase [Lonepinella sp. BR2474]|uniref:M15 family metallopeptidase n=1 Tax=Lonepinella sp. BR2474 TaxID=3434548 RepID=UPI003F6E18B4
MNRFVIFSTVLLTTSIVFANTSEDKIAQCLQVSYPQSIVAKDNQIQIGNKIFTVKFSHTNVDASNFQQLLNSPQIGDQFLQIYPTSFQSPQPYQDPGRIRYQPLFTAMYGETEEQVRQNLVKVHWKPSGKTILFNQKNGAAQALERVGNQIASDPTLANYVRKSSGSFYYRVIKGTNRLSAHAFGVAIDFDLPNELGKYWQWSGCKEGGNCPYPNVLLKDEKFNKVISIFEQHGFIWGGKWFHYDSVHFEYRPELLNPQCY